MIINPFISFGAAPAFTPTSLGSDLKVMLEADSYGLADNASITTDWSDLSGNNNHGILSGTPTYKTGQVNGNPCVRLGSSSAKFAWATGLLSAAVGAQYYLVLKVTNIAASGGMLFSGDGGFASHYPYNNGNVYDGWGSNVRQADPMYWSIDVTTWHLVHGWSYANDWAIHQNGVLKHSSASNVVTFPSNYYLGYNTAQYHNADIAGFYVWGGAKLSSGDDAAMLGYINDKYDLF